MVWFLDTICARSLVSEHLLLILLFFLGGGVARHERLVGQVIPKTQRPATGVWANADYLAARVPDSKAVGFGIGTPMAPLKNAHLAVLSVAGIANRAVLEGKDGRRVIVKGYSRKVPLYSRTEDEDEIVEKTTDAFETAMWCTDLETGRLIRVETGKASSAGFDVEFESMSLVSFLDTFGSSLTQQVAASNPSRYAGGEQQLPWSSAAFALIKRTPLGKQREMIHAIVNGLVNRWRGESHTMDDLLARVGVIAEMASGKTYLALCSAFLADLYACGGISQTTPAITLPQHLFPLIVLCPPIIARKWKREAEQTLPNVRAVIVKRLRTATAKERDEQEDEQNEREASENRPSDEIAEFRQFDPSFSGSSLSAIGCMDRVVARIRTELDIWQRNFDQARADGSTPPLKPCHIVILTTSTAKLGMEWMPIYRLKVARYVNPETKKVAVRRNADGEIYTLPCCPRCFRALKDERKVKQLANANEEFRTLQAQVEQIRKQQRLAAYEEEAMEPPQCYLSEQDLLGTKEKRVKHFCSACGEALWQYVAVRDLAWCPYSVLRTGGGRREPLPLPQRHHVPSCITDTTRRRYPLGDYVLDRYKGFFHLLIADEVHEGADGTALDFARQSLANACGRQLGLTGTLSNGYSRSLFRLYYVLNPSVRRDFQYHEAERWVDLYGKRQVTQKTYKKDRESGRSGEHTGDGATSKRRIGTPVTKEVAGFAPQGLARVLPCSTFLELVDVAPSLPPYREEVRVVPMGTLLGPTYEEFEVETTQVIGRMLACGDKSGLSSWWNGLLTYPNLPYRGWVCSIKKSGEVFGTAPALPEEFVYPKERAILDVVQQEVEQGRRVLIYTENTGYYDILPRLKQLLETRVRGRYGARLRVAVLRSNTVATIDREAWLDKQVQAGCDVLLCNPKLVKVGLDLLPFPTIVYVSVPKSTSDLRQSSRRSLRPGQTKPVNVIFFVYPSMESRLLHLMAKKMKASLMVEGKLPGEGLVSFGEQDDEDEGDMMLQLAREVLATLEQGTRSIDEQADEQASELQAMFREAAQIERDKNQVLGVKGQIQEDVACDAMHEVPLAISDCFPVAPVAPTTYEAHDDDPLSMEDDIPLAEPMKVTGIPLSVTTGNDPWAELRKKYSAPPKSRRKKAPYPETLPSLWMVAASADTKPHEEDTHHSSTQIEQSDQSNQSDLSDQLDEPTQTSFW